MDFMGKAVEVNLNAGLFVTLNPAGKGYGGRSKLPDNLQQMFRYDGVAAVPKLHQVPWAMSHVAALAKCLSCAQQALQQVRLSGCCVCPQVHCDDSA